jgi:creatinine amidohydrolase
MAGYSIFEGTIADMTWPEVEAAGRRGAVMLVPVAVIEQHGPHLPLATDTYAAYLLCVQTRGELERSGVETVVAPPYYFGMTPTTAMFPGSVGISHDVMASVLAEAMGSYASWGFTHQFILNHHGDPQHNSAIMQAIRAVRTQGVDAVLTLGGWVGEVVEQVYTSAFGEPLPLPQSAILRAQESEETRRARERFSRSKLNVHAEERETSLIMRWFPETLNKNIRIDKLPPVLPTMDEFDDAIAHGKWRELSPLGYIGDPSVATRENGELYSLEAADIARAIVALLGGKE